MFFNTVFTEGCKTILWIGHYAFLMTVDNSLYALQFSMENEHSVFAVHN
jgi:hypothetical protein